MNVNLGIWDKLIKLVLCLLFLASLAYLFYWYLPLIQKNQRYRKEILALDARIAEQERASRQLKGSIEMMQNDPRVIERLARERLSWAKTNEMVVRFEQPAKSPGQRERTPSAP
jgi:cell division protein FtsB